MNLSLFRKVYYRPSASLAYIVFGFILFSGITFILLSKIEDLSPTWLACIGTALFFSIYMIIVKNTKLSLFFMLAVSIPLNLDICLVSRNYIGSSINGIYLDLVDIIIFFLFLLWLLKKLNSGIKFNLFPKMFVPIMLFLGGAVLSLTVTTDKTWSIYGIIFLIKLIIMFLVVGNSITSRRDVDYILWCMIFSLSIQALVYLLQCYTGKSFYITGILEGNVEKLHELYGVGTQILRPRGFFGHANSAGNFFAASSIIAMTYFILKKKTQYKIFAGIAFVLGISALTSTYSRGGWLGFSISSSTLFFIYIKKRYLKAEMFLGLLIIFVIVISIFWQPIMTRLTSDDKGAAQSRVRLVKQAIRIITYHPIFGIGINTYTDIMKSYVSQEEKHLWFDKVHNQYFLIWVETGILGIIGFLCFLFAVFKTGIKNMQSRDISQFMLSSCVVFPLLAMCITITTQMADGGAIPKLIWFLASLIAALDKKKLKIQEQVDF